MGFHPAKFGLHRPLGLSVVELSRGMPQTDGQTDRHSTNYDRLTEIQCQDADWRGLDALAALINMCPREILPLPPKKSTSDVIFSPRGYRG